jgi:hypothetical protein
MNFLLPLLVGGPDIFLFLLLSVVSILISLSRFNCGNDQAKHECIKTTGHGENG